MRDQSPVREAAAGLAWGALGAWLGARQLKEDVSVLQKATTTVDEEYLSLLEGELKHLKGELKSARGQLPWLLGVAFCGGLLLGFLFCVGCGAA
eukprot:SAG22_NODE_1378_length_4547_cov_77.305755_5_plen_94_part_00